MVYKQNLVKTFKCYSDKSDAELIPIVDAYVAAGRRRNVVLKSIAIIIVLACVIGALIGFFKRTLNVDGNYFFSGVAGGMIGGLSVMAMVLIQRKDIKSYLKSKEKKAA